jgi:hypothetical protein
MRTLIGIALAILLLLGLGFSQGSSPGLMRDGVFTRGTNGEPAVVPGTRVVLRAPVTKETASDAGGAFAIDGPGIYEIEANAPDLYAVTAVEVSAGTSSSVRGETSVAAVTGTTSPQLTRLKATDCAFSRKVHHA